MKPNFILSRALLSLYFLAPLEVRSAASLTIQELPNGQVQITWPSDAASFSLEQTDSLSAPVQWSSINVPVANASGQFSVLIQPTAQTRFYRLRSGAAAVRAAILETSPGFGESSVAVTRETIFRVSAPLAANTMIASDHLYAEFGVRRLLSRIELSSDRRTVTLFYLENLPGSARIGVTFNGSGITDGTGADIDADGDGQPGGTRVLEFVTAGITGLPSTGVIGHVYASEKGSKGENRPLRNVTVTVDGAEETLRTTTDSDGFFKLLPAPAGHFFVHIDGRTADGSEWPHGEYYPFVGKAWEAVPGRTNNLAGGNGEIFLPLIPSAALQAVSAIEETRITFGPAVIAANPALAGVEVRVPPNTLFSENGTRGGKVGLAPVPPDRLPEPLPPGLNLPLVITIQTDGPMNFGQPVSVRFPNLPDPVTGQLLPPGAKSALWSFNHDTGRWEIQGPMTVTADGLYVESDPGVGVRQPGWHGVDRGSAGGCSPEPCPHDDDGDDHDDDEDDDDDDDDVDPCKKQRHLAQNASAECVASLASIFIKALPFVNCGISIGQGIGGATADCAVDFDGCSKTIISQTTSTILGCIPGVGGFGSAAWNCLLAANIADSNYERCKQMHQHSLALHAVPPNFPAVNPADIPHQSLLEQAQLFADAAALYAAVIGNAKWTVVVLPEEWPVVNLIFEKLEQSIHSDGASGERIAQSERDAIMAIGHPANISTADVSALIDRFDKIMAGTLPPQEFDTAAINAAATKLHGTALELQSRGWVTVYDGLIRALTKPSQDQNGILVPPVLVGGSASLSGLTARFSPTQATPRKKAKPVAAPLHYRLTDLFGGFVRRGRLTDQGTLDNLIMAPDTLYEIAYYDPASNQKGRSFFISGPAGERFQLPRFILLKADTVDTDGDHLPDEAELIVGTNPSTIDTDGDGVGDGEELRNGLNPLDGLSETFGPVASVEIFGRALNLAAQNDLAVLIGPNAGLTFLDVADPDKPVLLTRFDGIGDVDALALMWPWLLTGHRQTGLALLNVEDATKPEIKWRTEPPIRATSVAIGFGRAYAAGDRLRVYDLASGELMSEVRTNGYGTLRIAGDRLYAMLLSRRGSVLTVFRLDPGEAQPVFEGSVEVTGELSPQEQSAPLFVADGYAYVGMFDRYHVIDVRDPMAPVVVSRSSPQSNFANHALATDGAGLLAAVTSFAGESTLRASIYDASTPTVTTNLLGGFDTPGTARKLALYGGRMLIADESAGLTVANYRTRLFETNPPSINLVPYSTFRNPDIHESASFLRVMAQARDDAVVRNVEFYVDNQRVTSMGTYPFETDLRTPSLSLTKQSFVLQARAFDTAGNSTWSVPVTIGLTNELRPPFMTAFTPASGGRYPTGSVVQVTASFNEPVAVATLATGWTLSWVGGDGKPGTADDVRVPATVRQRGPTDYALEFTQPLAEGFYAVRATTNLADVFGNRLRNEIVWEFGIRAVITFIGPGDLWSQTPATRTNWSGGAIPTVNDFVEIKLADGRPLRVRQDVAAFSLVAQNPMAFQGFTTQGFDAQLRLGRRAIFEKVVTMDGQVEWIGGESEILDQLLIVGLRNNCFLNSHILNNRGHVTMDKGNGGLLLRDSLGELTAIRNHPGATWEQLSGSIVGTALSPPAEFDNFGLFIKRGPDSSRIWIDQFINLGTVEVHEGTLEFIGYSADEGGHQHVGTYLVNPGARLVFTSDALEYRRTTRIYGGGDVEFNSTGAEVTFPGAIEVGGTMTVTAARMNFAGVVNSSGPWRIIDSTLRFTGLNPQLTGPVRIERNGTLMVNGLTPLILNSLTMSNHNNNLTVDTILEVNGPLMFEGGRLLGLGNLRANGAVTFNGPLQGSVGSGQAAGRFELAGSATCSSNVSVQVNGYSLSVLAGGSLDFANAKEFRFGRTAITNDGSLLKATPGVTRVSNGIHNRGSLRLTMGSLDIVGPLLQTAGITTLSGTGMILSGPPGNQDDPPLNVQAGRFEGDTTVVCGSVTNAAVVSPGVPIGTLDFQVGTHPVYSVYLQTASGTLVIDIAGTEVGLEHDQLKISGRALLGGNLEVVVAKGYDPPLGHEFTILTSQNVERTFGELRGAALPGGKRLEAVYEATKVKLRVVATP